MKKKTLGFFIITIIIVIVVVLFIFNFYIKDNKKATIYSGGKMLYNRIYRIDANPDLGFHWPYLVYIPDSLKKENQVKILLIPNNSNIVTDDDQIQEEKTIQKFYSQIHGRKNLGELKYVLLTPVFPRPETKFIGKREYNPHSLDRGIILAENKKYLAVKVRCSGVRLSENSKMMYNLRDIWVVQNGLIYACCGADFNPQEAFDEGNGFVMTLYMEYGWDYTHQFNFIEHYPGGSGFLFRDVNLAESGEIHNSRYEDGNIKFQIVSIKDVDQALVWNDQGEQYYLDEFYKLRRIDLQLCVMIKDMCRIMYEEFSKDTEEKISLWGFSASADFADRFAVLHPDIVKKVAVGGSNIILPVGHWQGENLPYPVGIFDYQEITGQKFDLEVFASIERFIYRGENDQLGSYAGISTEQYYRENLLPEFKRNKMVPLTEDGNINENQEEELRYRIFGNEMSVYRRFLQTEELFKEMGLNNHYFKVYSGIGHEITDEVIKDYIEFLND